ncbi:MAG: hypothetical protein WC355_00285 [Candidatus Omnitrophota bacterium]|jgi:hypothetical protein
MKIANPQKCIVFFDFDSMLPVFPRDNLWVKLEKEWEAEEIGAHRCLKGGQVKGSGQKYAAQY